MGESSVKFRLFNHKKQFYILKLTLVPIGSPPLGEVEDLLLDVRHHLGGPLVTADGVEELAVLLQGHAFQKDTASLE